MKRASVSRTTSPIQICRLLFNGVVGDSLISHLHHHHHHYYYYYYYYYYEGEVRGGSDGKARVGISGGTGRHFSFDSGLRCGLGGSIDKR